MEEFERKLKRAGFRARRDYARSKAKPMGPKRQAAKARRVAERVKKMGLDGALCLGCGSGDLSTFQLDHIAGRKHSDDLWPLCEKCHQEKTFMDYLEPPPADNPRNAFEVIAQELRGVAHYFELAIRFLENHVVRKLRAVADFLSDLAKQGYGDDLEFPP